MLLVYRNVLLVLMGWILLGCVAPQWQPTTGGEVAPRSSLKRVGYLVNVQANPTHTHIGTTALTNFTKTYPFAWNVPQYMEQQLATHLQQIGGVEAVNLRTQGLLPHEINGLLKQVNGVWMVASGKAEVYNKLTQRLGLSAVVIVNQAQKRAFKDCGMLGCKEITVKGYGVLSQSFINTNNFYSATPFFAHIYTLKPLGSLDRYLTKINQDPDMTLVASSVGSKVKPNKIGFLYPERFNEWTEKEFRPFLAPVQLYIQRMSELIATVIRDWL